MAEPKYATAPIASEKMPRGIPFIVGNEAAERFSYYGMNTILFAFMTEHLITRDGSPDMMDSHEAAVWVHTFKMAVYFVPILGAVLADAFWGKYRTIIWLSMVYCLGHLALALDATRLGLMVGLSLIALGSGGIKSCVSAHVGDQFGATNRHLLERVFGWFYLAINVGAFVSSLLTPVLLDWEHGGPHLAFGIPGALMALATLVFWMGRNRFVHIPPGGMGFVKETFSGEGLKTLGKLAVVYLFVALFWSIFDQSTSTWVGQAQQMDRRWLGVEWRSSQMQAVNPILILILVPLFNYVLYPAVGRVVRLTPLRKIGAGLFLAGAAACIPAFIQMKLDAGQTPSITWQIFGYVVLTSAEVLVSITCLEFSYTQAPKRMKSLVMGVFLLSVSVGNFFIAAVNFFISHFDSAGWLSGARYYWFFAALMLVSSLAFVAVAINYKERTYIQDEAAGE